MPPASRDPAVQPRPGSGGSRPAARHRARRPDAATMPACSRSHRTVAEQPSSSAGATLRRMAICLAMVVVELSPHGKAVVVDRGGDSHPLPLRLARQGQLSRAATRTRSRRAGRPTAEWIVYRRRDQGAVQLWRAQHGRQWRPGDHRQHRRHRGFPPHRRRARYRLCYQTGIARGARPRSTRKVCPASTMTIAFRRPPSNRPFAPAPIAREAWFLELESGYARAATPERSRAAR
jgi:hypothetical protein